MIQIPPTHDPVPGIGSHTQVFMPRAAEHPEAQNPAACSLNGTRYCAVPAPGAVLGPGLFPGKRVTKLESLAPSGPSPTTTSAKAQHPDTSNSHSRKPTSSQSGCTLENTPSCWKVQKRPLVSGCYSSPSALDPQRIQVCYRLGSGCSRSWLTHTYGAGKAP